MAPDRIDSSQRREACTPGCGGQLRRPVIFAGVEFSIVSPELPVSLGASVQQAARQNPDKSNCFR